jgi:chromosome segregation ATPase
LSDYKKTTATLKSKLESSDRELTEKDGLIKELSIKLHNLTERNADLEETVGRQKDGLSGNNNKITELEHSLLENKNDFDRKLNEAEAKLEAALQEVDQMRETIKKQKKELNSIRNEGADNKTGLKAAEKANELLEKRYNDLAAQFSAYKVGNKFSFISTIFFRRKPNLFLSSMTLNKPKSEPMKALKLRSCSVN